MTSILPPAPVPPPAAWEVAPVPADHPDATVLLREYTDELVSRYYRRPATTTEIDTFANDIADLFEPRGTLLVARSGATLLGCTGIHWLDGERAELTRVYVRTTARRGGAGARLIGAAEQAAQARGAQRMLLNTRKDLTEAIALYIRLGYRPTEPFGDDPYAELWLARPLGRD
ncbi:GNAT family N-acetyltransferase [Kitasatospora sp. NPDC094015]|uniref:GNAT family N-acetyltransferase n=1 Tax=Kitasatospora sp. NPDC094015 TaxID=3155205 RepID=UPI0033344F09